MAKYSAKAALFIGRRLIEPGETFESDLPPGKNWLPLDAAARAAVDRRDGRGPADDRRMAINDAKPPASESDIPEGWEDLPSEDIVKLSRALGAPKNNNATQARGFIEKEVARRAAEAEGEA